MENILSSAKNSSRSNRSGSTKVTQPTVAMGEVSKSKKSKKKKKNRRNSKPENDIPESNSKLTNTSDEERGPLVVEGITTLEGNQSILINISLVCLFV